MSLSKIVPSTLHQETVNSLSRTIISPYAKHLLTYGDKVKSSLMRDLNSLTMVCCSEMVSSVFFNTNTTPTFWNIPGIFQDYYFTNPVYLQRIKKSSSASLTELSENCKSLITLVRSAVPASLEHTNSHTLSDVLAALDFYFDLFCEKLTGFIK